MLIPSSINTPPNFNSKSKFQPLATTLSCASSTWTITWSPTSTRTCSANWPTWRFWTSLTTKSAKESVYYHSSVERARFWFIQFWVPKVALLAWPDFKRFKQAAMSLATILISIVMHSETWNQSRSSFSTTTKSTEFHPFSSRDSRTSSSWTWTTTKSRPFQPMPSSTWRAWSLSSPDTTTLPALMPAPSRPTRPSKSPTCHTTTSAKSTTASSPIRKSSNVLTWAITNSPRSETSSR